ncbi:hypothetical protein AB0L10_38595 [Streptomyces flaveolus]|uniref:hypothetical protein n=1 Tax=Streptomyces flaveolus TaxID=67297 RepID=UPI00343C765B
MVVTGRTDHHLVLDKTVAARARRVLKAKVKELEKTGEVRRRGPASALLAEHLRASVIAAPDNRLGIRDRSIGLTAFAIVGREHEVAFLRVRDVVETEHGMEVDVRVSKIKPRKVKVPFGSRPSSCPVRAWRAWKESAGLTDPDDFAYKPLHNRWHTVMEGGLDPETIGDVITRLGKWAEAGALALPRVAGRTPPPGTSPAPLRRLEWAPEAVTHFRVNRLTVVGWRTLAMRCLRPAISRAVAPDTRQVAAKEALVSIAGECHRILWKL